MPAAAPGDALACAAPTEAPDAQQQQPPAPPLPALAFAPCAATEPVRRVVSILQTQIAALEKQAKMKVKPSKDQNSQSVGKCDDVLPLLEFAWDLIKQVMGIAVLSENEAKKQAKKESTLRKAQDLQLVHQVILVWTCIEQIKANRSSFLSDTAEMNSISQEDMEVVDKICPELSRNPNAEEDEPSFQDKTMDTARHILAIIEGDSSQVFGTTYAHIKDVVSNVYERGYFDHPRESVVEDVERPDATIGEDAIENSEHPTVPPHSTPIVPVNPPPPAPQAVPTPSFSILPPRAPPVTLQQVEHAYFAQYGHQHQPVVPEVFGPQSFIFIQDSELDSADISQQPTPRPASPAAIPSQTFTNQSFTIPQHFPPDMAPNPLIPINEMAPPVHFPANVNDVAAIANYSTANPPPPIPMPPSHPNMPPHMTMPAGQVVNHPHPLQQRLPSPSFQQPIAFKPQPTHAADPAGTQNESVQVENKPSTPVEQETAPRDWIDNSQIENPPEPLEIDEWNPETTPDSSAQNDGQATDKFRPRGRGRGTGNFRGRGSYQNGRSGAYFRNNENGQPNNTVNGGNYENNYRENRNDGNRFENYQGNYRGRGGANGRGNPRQNGGARMPRNGQSRGNGGPRPQFARKPTTSNNHFDARNGVDSNNKPTYAH